MYIHGEMVMFYAIKNGLPSQMRTIGAFGAGFLSSEDRKNRKSAPIQYSGAEVPFNVLHWQVLYWPL